MKDYTTSGLEEIVERFQKFAESECKANSPLYHQLSKAIAEDSKLLELAAHAKYGQPIPNSFLAAVHYLLLAQPGELAGYYPSISGRSVDEIPLGLFKAFCLEHADDIKILIENRMVQTNVISRCSYLAPIFSGIIAHDPDKPVTIIDIGTSAGLTLNWDKYEYHYSNGLTVGNSAAKIYTEVRGNGPEQFQLPNKKIRKIGIDQHVIDPTNADDARWLRALIWPDQLERFAAMDEALKVDELKTIEFVEADSVSGFERIIADVPNNEFLIVYCTHAMYQFPEGMRKEFWDMLDKIGMERDLNFISAEAITSQQEKYGVKNTVVEGTFYQSGEKDQRLLAETNGHGNWINLYV